MRSDRGFAAVVVSAVGLVLIVGGQLVGNRHTVEDGLATRSTEALQRAGLDTVAVDFAGRDARLAGPAGELQQAAGVVRSLPGVRVVDTEVGPAVAQAATGRRPVVQASAVPSVRDERDDAAPAPTVLPTEGLRPLLPISLTFEDRTIDLTGQVPSRKAADRVLDTVRTAAAPVDWTVTGRLRVDPGLDARARPEWYPGLSQLVGVVPRGTGRLVARFDQDHVTLRGTVPGPELERTLLEAARTTVIAPYWVQDGLDVKD